MESEISFVVDPAYEFDAPQFYDFTRLSTGSVDASAWFACRGALRLLTNCFLHVLARPPWIVPLNVSPLTGYSRSSQHASASRWQSQALMANVFNRR